MRSRGVRLFVATPGCHLVLEAVLRRWIKAITVRSDCSVTVPTWSLTVMIEEGVEKNMLGVCTME